MPLPPRVAALGSLLADETRAAMLVALMDGRAWTATELAAEGKVGAPTASSHLARLTGSGLLSVVRQGRHRYYRIADDQLPALLEQLMCLAESRARVGAPRPPASDGGDAALRHARTCYDHLAGACGVRLFATLRAQGIVAVDAEGEDATLTPAGRDWCRAIGVEPATVARARRPLCRTCLDWSERRPHLAGAIGAGLLDRMLDRGLARRMPGTRALTITRDGMRFIETLALA